VSALLFGFIVLLLLLSRVLVLFVFLLFPSTEEGDGLRFPWLGERRRVTLQG
jgi:hypothetical protein